MGRLKTGTPARVDARSVDLQSLELQEGDAKTRWFSWYVIVVDVVLLCLPVCLFLRLYPCVCVLRLRHVMCVMCERKRVFMEYSLH